MAKKKRKLRNIGIMAHIDAGKTTVTERILYYAGRTYKMAEVHDGGATMDFMQQERDRGITISSAVTQISWGESDIFIIDTPGHVDFTVEVERSLRVLDGAVALFDGVAGVEPQSETVWFQADKHNVARIAFINKMDRPGADFDFCVRSIRDNLKAQPIAIQMPVFIDHHFEGVIDLITQQWLTFDPQTQGLEMSAVEIPEQFRQQAHQRRERMIEQLAEIDDDIAADYLEGNEVSQQAIIDALRAATLSKSGVPVLCGSGLKNIGIQPLIDAITYYLPAPDELPALEGINTRNKVIQRERSKSAPLCALVFKVQQIEAKKLAFIRLYSGVLTEDDSVYNSTLKTSYKVKQLYRLYANKMERVSSAKAGEIIAIPKVRTTATGDTLCDGKNIIVLESIDTTAPVVSVAIEAETLQDKPKIEYALKQICEEDPTVHFEENEQTGDLIIRGMGELHIEVVLERIRTEFNLPLRSGKPSVVCQQSICETFEQKLSQQRTFEEEEISTSIEVTVSPLPRSTPCVCKLDSSVSESEIHPDIIRAALEGAENALQYGPEGYELVDTQLVIHHIACDARTPAALSAMRITAGEATRSAIKNAKPVVLQPLMTVDIYTTDEHLGDLIGDLNQRQGLIKDIENATLRSVIHATVPLKAMFGYALTLRSITHGRGSFSMKFNRFDAIDVL